MNTRNLLVLTLVLGVVVPTAAAAPLAGPCVPGAVYDPACDVDHDGDVDIFDIQLTTGHWNQAGTWTGGDGWSLTGNAGTNPANNFVGTVDGQPLVVKVNGQQAMLIRPAVDPTDAPTVIAGHGGNTPLSGVVGAAIAGGGRGEFPNIVHDHYGTIGGGADNEAGDADGILNSATYATVGGGLSNTASRPAATASGGRSNTASGYSATVSGGQSNTASGNWATIGGGLDNTVTADDAAVGGGSNNSASGPGATVPGGHNNHAAGWSSFAAGSHAHANHIGAFVWADSTSSDFLSSGNDQFLIRAYGGVGIGVNDPQTQLDVGGKVRIRDGWRGLQLNGVDDAPHDYHLISGCIGGGAQCIDGQPGNSAGEGGFALYDNTAAAYRLAVSREGSVGVGTFHPQGSLHLVSPATAPPVSLPGSQNGLLLGLAGTNNYKWIQSYAGILALNPAGNHVGIGRTDAAHPLHMASGAHVTAAGVWTNNSSRTRQADFAAEDKQVILDTLAELPVQSWRYLTEDASIRHLGPSAEDFHAAFGLGNDATAIGTIDADGVALAAIQALYAHSLEQAAQNEALRGQIEALQQQNADLATRLEVLEQRIGTTE